MKRILNTRIAKFLTSQKINRPILILPAIIILGATLRLSNFDNLLRFNADQVRDAQIVQNMQSQEYFPLLGPKAGGTKFKLGPAFYYLEYASGLIFGFSPWGIALFIPLLSVASLGLFYLIFKKIFSTNISLALTFLYATSFYAIKYSRFAWNPNVIPFFLFSFILLMIAIVNKKTTRYTYPLLGLVIGIGIQLHTTLLVLMPLTFLGVMLFVIFKNKSFKLSGVIFSLIIILLLNALPIYHDLSAKDKNFQEFFAGTQKKAGTSLSIINNLAQTGQFFLQGTVYSMTGSEPQKNWINLTKFIKSKNITEYLLAIVSLSFFALGLWLTFRKINQTEDSNKKNIIYLLMAISLLLFTVFIPIGNELNLRFFIVLIFLPYLILGLIFEYLAQKFSPLLFNIILIFSLITLSLSNLYIYSGAYNLDDYTARDSVYGGISLGELNTICVTIGQDLTKMNPLNKTIYLETFDFNRSIQYICQEQQLSIKSFSQDKIPSNSLVFVLTLKEQTKKSASLEGNDLAKLSSRHIGRYNLTTLFYK